MGNQFITAERHQINALTTMMIKQIGENKATGIPFLISVKPEYVGAALQNVWEAMPDAIKRKIMAGAVSIAMNLDGNTSSLSIFRDDLFKMEASR